MKSRIALIFITLMATSFSFAQSDLDQSQNATQTQFSQQQSSMKKPRVRVYDPISSEGFRVGLELPMLSADLKSGSSSISQKLDQVLGVSLGYAKLRIRELGWTTNLSYLDIKNNGASNALVRIDGNLAYAFNRNFNTKAGLNVSNLTKGDANAGVGFQAGLGVQMNKSVGIDLAYTQMNQTGTSSFGNSVNLTESGVELGLNGTF